MSEKQISISYDELRQVEFRCSICGSGLSVFLRKESEVGFFKADRRSFDVEKLERCGICQHEFSDQFRGALRALASFFRNAEDSKANINFYVKSS